MAFPDHHNAGPVCNLALYLTHKTNADAWSIGDIYTREFWSTSRTGLIQLIKERIGDAATNNYITTKKRDDTLSAIQLFDSYGSASIKSSSLRTLLCRQGGQDPDDSISEQLRQIGIFLPHRTILDADRPLIKDHFDGTNGKTALLDLEITYDKTDSTKVKKLGQLKFYELFATPAAFLKQHKPDSYSQLREANILGIFRLHPTRPLVSNPTKETVGFLSYMDDIPDFHLKSLLADGTDPSSPAFIEKLHALTYTSGNGKCCENGTCKSNAPIGLYCGPVSDTDNACNAMSDPCP